MDQTTLRERLTKLHADLTNAQKENPAARQSLGEILPEVQRLLDQLPGAEAIPEDRSLPDRLERIAVRFEADHPTLAASARKLIDLLSEVGI
jgi:Domain of unknown function (DUF4404)